MKDFFINGSIRKDSEFILLNDFTCHETGLHNADWFHRMIRSGSSMRYKTQVGRPFRKSGMSLMTIFDIYAIMLNPSRNNG